MGAVTMTVSWTRKENQEISRGFDLGLMKVRKEIFRIIQRYQSRENIRELGFIGNHY